jgi:hypothetical protein
MDPEPAVPSVPEPVAPPSPDTVVASPQQGWSFISILVLFFMIYCFGGCFLNWKREGATGIDAIPHLELWVTLPSKISDHCERCMAIYRHRFSHRGNSEQTYDEVETMAYDGPFEDDVL